MEAWVNCACAPASEDSDCERSVIVIFPLSNLTLSVSTCLTKRLRFLLFISNFSLAKINPVKVSIAL